MKALALRARWPLAAAGSAGLACLARFGYTFGLGDHLVLMPKGLSLADSSALRNDWFVAHAPQPHWFFDLITWAGAELDVLPVVYFLYWVASLLAFGTAAVWLCRRFLPGREWAAVLLGPILAAGPEKILGSTTPLLGVALPHMLGGCLAMAALSALLNRYWWACAATALAAGLMHVQHGADLAPVLLFAAVFACTRGRERLLVSGTGVAVLGIAAVVGQLRSIDSGGRGWEEVCRTVIPYHCNADSWSPDVLVGGGLVILLAVSLLVTSRDERRLTFAVIGLPAIGLALAVAADRFDIPVAESLVKATNAYRLSALVVPFAALALLRLALAAPVRDAALRHVAATALLLTWVLGPDASAHVPGRSPLFSPVILVGVCVGALALLARAYTASASARGPVPLVAACAVMLGTTIAVGGGAQSVAFGLPTDGAVGAAAVAVGKAIPDGGVIATSPALTFLPNLSRRAVVADCKRVPYGGTAWEEYKERLAALGGWQCGPDTSRFDRLSPAGVEALRDRFGATHALLMGDDPKQVYAQQHWRPVLTIEPAPTAYLKHGWTLYELPPA